jgi:hypothetical protein
MGKRLGGLFAQPRDYRDSIGSEYQKRIMSVSNYPRQLRFKNTVEEIEHSLFVQLSHLSKCPPESASFSTKLVAAAIRSRRVMSGTRRAEKRLLHTISGSIGRNRMAKTRRARRWSAKVIETSDALDLEPRLFRAHDPKRIAASLKRSALSSRRRKANPFQSAMSMLNFYINRAGKNLSVTQRRSLEAAKTELRRQFGRTAN